MKVAVEVVVISQLFAGARKCNCASGRRRVHAAGCLPSRGRRSLQSYPTQLAVPIARAALQWCTCAYVSRAIGRGQVSCGVTERLFAALSARHFVNDPRMARSQLAIKVPTCLVAVPCRATDSCCQAADLGTAPVVQAPSPLAGVAAGLGRHGMDRRSFFGPCTLMPLTQLITQFCLGLLYSKLNIVWPVAHMVRRVSLCCRQLPKGAPTHTFSVRVCYKSSTRYAGRCSCSLIQ